MALNLSTISSALTPNSASALSQLARSTYSSYNSTDDSELGVGLSASDFALSSLTKAGKGGKAGGAAAAAGAADGASSFQQALLKAMDGVSASQAKSDDLLQRVVANPDSVDAQDVTIAMAEANMTLNMAKNILSRIVTAWKDVINTR